MITRSNQATIIQFMKRTPERVESGDFPRSWTEEMIEYCHHYIIYRETGEKAGCLTPEERKEHRRLSRKKYFERVYKHFNVASHGPYGSPVRCIETGEIFDSAAKASRSMELNDDAVGNSIHRGQRCGGYHWEYVGA